MIRSYIPLYNDAILLTFRIGLLGILTAFAIGLSGAAALYFKADTAVNKPCYKNDKDNVSGNDDWNCGSS